MTGMFGNRWWVVFASICGLLVGTGAVHIFTFGVFLKPVTEELSIGRGELSSGLILTSTLNALGCLPLGYLLDRYGVRRVMMPGIILYAIGIMGWSLLGPTATLIFLKKSGKRWAKRRYHFNTSIQVSSVMTILQLKFRLISQKCTVLI